jgi:phage terminase small subunit
MTKQDLVLADDLAMSPQMAALPTARQRAFITCLFEVDGRGDVLSAAACARAAGYAGDAHQVSAAAQRLLADPRIQLAIQSETQRRIRSLGPKALQHLQAIMGDRTHKDQYKAVAAILNRVDPEVTKLDAHVTHEVIDHRADALNELRALIALGVAREKLEEMFGYTGLLALERQLAEGDKGAVVDAEFTEIEPEGEDEIR